MVYPFHPQLVAGLLVHSLDLSLDVVAAKARQVTTNPIAARCVFLPSIVIWQRH